MEITEKERQMSTKGIVFSTNEPNALFVEEGKNGGRYMCHAFLLTWHLMLQIVDITDGNCNPITIDGKPVERIEISSYIDEEDDRITSSHSPKIYFEGEEGCVDYQSLCDDKYEGLSLDVQAKLFFVDFLKAYINEKYNNNTQI